MNYWHIFICSILLFTVSPAKGKIAELQEQDGPEIKHNIELYSRLIKAGEFENAYEPWLYVFTHSPLAIPDVCTDGTKILHALIAAEQDSAEHQKLFEQLTAIYDRQAELLDSLNVISKKPVTLQEIRGRKAHEYVVFAGDQMDTDTVYQMLQDAVPVTDEASECYMLQDLINISLKKLQADNTHKKQFILDFLTVSGRLAQIKDKTQDEKGRQFLKIVENDVNSCFINSGMAGCENMQKAFKPEIEANRHNLVYLKQIISIMERLKCTDDEAYFAASEAAYSIEPTAETALGCAYMFYKQDSIGKSQHFFDQAIELEKDTLTKAKNSYEAAVMLYSKKHFSKAREYAQKALSFDPKCGKAYMLIAQMYASSPNWSDEATLNKCTYYAAIDKLQQAKAADPRLTDEVQRLIVTYATKVPKEEDLFFLGLKKGNAVTIGGWIKEKTTIK